ncbi:hypothetical protein B0O80DRAFT_145722 [Mortierella sp. GBAus27b]|nr:hypothetical protein B0O80DRAFT_145722 [Mortierella sp. GBAus27b]
MSRADIPRMMGSLQALQLSVDKLRDDRKSDVHSILSFISSRFNDYDSTMTAKLKYHTDLHENHVRSHNELNDSLVGLALKHAELVEMHSALEGKHVDMAKKVEALETRNADLSMKQDASLDQVEGMSTAIQEEFTRHLDLHATMEFHGSRNFQELRERLEVLEGVVKERYDQQEHQEQQQQQNIQTLHQQAQMRQEQHEQQQQQRVDILQAPMQEDMNRQRQQFDNITTSNNYLRQRVVWYHVQCCSWNQ